MKTNELIGPPLDWAVAKCDGANVEVHSADMITKRRLQYLTQEEADTLPPPKPYLVVPGVGNANYSTDWSQGGPIIERENIWLTHHVAAKMHGAHKGDEHWFQRGPTTLVAAMRCYVASKLGNEVEIPEELL